MFMSATPDALSKVVGSFTLVSKYEWVIQRGNFTLGLDAFERLLY